MSARHWQMIGLLGDGVLVQALATALGAFGRVTRLNQLPRRDQAPSWELMVVAREHWAPVADVEVDTYCRRWGIAWLGAHPEPGTMVVGPLVRGGQPGCLGCVERRRQAAQAFGASFASLRTRITAGDACNLARAHGPAIEIVVALVARLLNEDDSPADPALPLRFYQLVLETLAIRRHHCLPDPHCPHCGRLEEDQPPQPVLAPRLKLTSGQYRLRNLRAERAALQERYVDPEAGMIGGLGRDPSSLYANVSARIRLPLIETNETGFGRTLDYATSQAAAVAEALERYGGIRPGGRRSAIRASFQRLGSTALDPTRLGLHSPEQYCSPGFPYRLFDSERPYLWVWGLSLTRQQPLLVPQRYAYYGPSAANGDDERFVYETSNGCALGSCLEEAALYGLLELIERDAFLLTWYTRQTAPRIELRTAPLRARLMVERLTEVTGYSVHAFNITGAEGVPCVWVIAVDEAARPDTPRALCAAGAHLDPAQALTGALHELGPQLWRLGERYRSRRAHAHLVAADASRVVQMEDHALRYCCPEAFGQLAFLHQTPDTQTWAEAFARQPWPAFDDLRDDLLELVGRLAQEELEVIVVDQTAPEHRAGGFSCVKAIVPGLIPMTFGQQMRRTHGLPRLLELPARRGYASDRLTDGELNAEPHPFP